MAVDFNITAESRADVGKGASRRLRKQNKVPGIMYGSRKDPQSILIDHDHLMHHLEHEAFYSHILTVTVDGKADKAVLKAVQRHPARPKIMHVDFQRVGETDVITMRVPLHFTGGDLAPGVKTEGGIVSHLMSAVEISCMAKDLPEYLEVDISGLHNNQSLHLSDIALPKGVNIPALAQADHDLPIVSIHVPRGAAEEEAAAPAAEAAPAAPAEGGTPSA
jgi:large subunit ribosomal protein L25